MDETACEECGIALLPVEAREGTRCFRCRDDGRETPVAKGTCKEAGCTRPISTAKPSLGLCYGHLKHHPEASPSIRAKTRGQRGKAPAGRREGKRGRRASVTIRCDACDQPLPRVLAESAVILTEAGLKPEDALRAARRVLQAAG
jgi:hypothetical protein